MARTPVQPPARQRARTIPAKLGGTRHAVMMLGMAIGALYPATAPAQALGQYVYGQILESEIPLSTATGRNLGVRDRVKPELQAAGLPLGSFRLYPDVLGGLGLSTNVIGAETGGRADGYVEFNPTARIESQWARHALNGSFYYDGLRFFGTPAKNQNGFLAQVDGRIDILGQDTVAAIAGFRRSYEDQQEASFPLGGGGSVAVDQPNALLRGTYVVNRARITVSTDYNGFTYHDTISTNGTLLDLTYRNRDVYRGTVRAEYLLGKDNSVFAQTTYRRTDYRTTDLLQDRTSNEWRASVGAIADVTQLLRVAGAVGYFRRTYPDPTFSSIDGVAIDIRAALYLTPLTTITALALRQPEEAAVVRSSGYVETRVGARIDHELLRNVVPYLSVDYSTARFKGIEREDRVTNGGGGVDYYLGRTLTLSLNAAYVSRHSHGIERGPNINEFRGLFAIRFHP